jgi:hypothetical protein
MTSAVEMPARVCLIHIALRVCLKPFTSRDSIINKELGREERIIQLKIADCLLTWRRFRTETQLLVFISEIVQSYARRLLRITKREPKNSSKAPEAGTLQYEVPADKMPSSHSE